MYITGVMVHFRYYKMPGSSHAPPSLLATYPSLLLEFEKNRTVEVSEFFYVG